MFLSKNSSKYLFLYFSKFHGLFMERGILQKYFSVPENQNELNWDK
jgi:hypothetical protein